MYARVIALVLALSMLVPALASAQRGRGGGGGGGGGHRPQEEGPDAIGKYGLRNEDVLQAIEDGEGPAALAAYEKGAAEAEKNGSFGAAARAGAAAVHVAAKLGMLQKVLTLGPRVLDAAGKATASPGVSKSFLNVAVQLARAQRSVNEHEKARAVLERALAYAHGPAAQFGRTVVGPTAKVLEALSSMESARGEHAKALAHAQEAVRLIEGVLAERANEENRWAQRRQASRAYLHLGS